MSKPPTKRAKAPPVVEANADLLDSAPRLPVVSSMDDAPRFPSTFKDDGDIRLFSGSDDRFEPDEGMKLFKDD